MGKRVCIFCKQDKQLSREHIYPQWLLREFDIEKEMTAGSHQNILGGEISVRSMPFNKLVNGLVCVECNNGWMSRIESNAMAPLTELAYKGPKALTTLDKNAKNIAFWAIKTAMTLNYGTNYRRIIHERHLTLMYKMHIPARLIVSISFLHEDSLGDHPGIGWVQTENRLTVRNTDSPGRPNAKLNYNIVIQLRRLLIKIAHTPLDSFNYEHSGRELKIYSRAEEISDQNLFFEDIMQFSSNGVFIEN